MDRLDRYRIFVHVADLRSFIQASNVLDLPRATVSAAIAQLEHEVGVRLLHRTTRQVSLTPDGATLLERVRPLLSEAHDIAQLFQTRAHQVSGALTVDVPSRIARRLVVPALPALLAHHPRLQLSLGSSDRAIDLVQAGVDCAVRFGAVKDSSLVQRRLGMVGLVNCASPAYLQAQGVPHHLDDLDAIQGGHWMVGYASPTTGRTLPWEWQAADGTPQTLALAARVIANNVESYIACARAGLGLIQIPRFDVADLLQRGELVEVMPAHCAPPLPVTLLYPHRRQKTRRLSVFMDWFEALMKPHLDR
ncbi:LysR family transcriptional regulator [Comamonas serinivorans]|uniref:LysR family transcriptional regulator n=1 Tax=Comamonas serinivorans TaxID=1082851 RepID=A0A1Y0ESN0_9BURK|nr:LysR family transcriptional regulator [Comamonas serinivorans]ARU06232.1 LysR family transcriptional regulator [Comamonas serinivorans]